MVWLYVLLGILLLLVLLLWLPIHLYVAFREEFRLKVRYGFVAYQVLPEKPNKKKKKKAQAKEEPLTKEKNTLEKIREKCKGKGVSFFLGLFKEIAQIVSRLCKQLSQRIVVRKFELSMRLGGDDAADAALHYGSACAVVYPAAGMLLSNLSLKQPPKLQLQVDFESKKSTVDFEAHVSIRLWSFLCLFWDLYRHSQTLLEIVQQQPAKEKPTEGTPNSTHLNDNNKGGAKV